MKIAQIGTFNVENFGDLLFPDVLKKSIDKKHSIDIFSPIGGKKCFDDTKVYCIDELEKKCLEKKYDLIIIGGGDLLRTDPNILIKNDSYGHSSKFSLDLWAYPILVSNKLGIPIAFNAIGVTNNFTVEEIPHVKKLLEMVDYISVRDVESLLTLEQIGIKDINLVPDTVLSISTLLDKIQLDYIYDDLISKKIIPKIDNYIVFQHNSRFIDDKNYYDKLVLSLKSISKTKKILFMPIGYVHDDDKVLKKLYEEKINNVFIVNLDVKLNPLEQISILNHSSGFIGTSMHGSVVTFSYRKPIIILNTMNSKKLHGFAKISNNEDVDVNDLNNLVYVFENKFGKVDTSNLKNNIAIIKKHFKKLLNIKKVNNHILSVYDYMNMIYYFNYHKEEFNFGYYFNNIDGVLNRNIFLWNLTNNVLKIKLNHLNGNIIKLYPFINEDKTIKNLKSNCKFKIYNSKKVDCFYFLTKDSYLVFNNTGSINLSFELTNQNEFIEHKNSDVPIKAYNDLLNEYNVLKNKYINLLKKEE